MEEQNKNETSDIVQLLLNMVDNQKLQMHNQTKTFIIVIVCYTILLLSMVIGFFIYDSQFEYTDTVTKTITQEVSGDDSEISNYNDNAVHNEGTAGDE